MLAFGESFDLHEFKKAFNTNEDIDAYNRVQALERALGRVQNFIADLAQDGVKLAQLPSAPDQHISPTNKAFAALHQAGVISGQLRKRLMRAQEARSVIEHGYIETSASQVHAAAVLIHSCARDFIVPYRGWIETYLDDLDG